ncbi:MAG: chromate resistance protein [Chloroflexi bacterium]|nr:MAG: chromate resistance protein [Chloroflexota bacterium]
MPLHFITRERIHVDRISTAWAIRKFVDPEATFEFVPRTADVTAMAGIPFDVRGAELGHHRGRCTLEALIDKYGLDDEPLRRMSRVVRAADLPHDEPSPAVTAGVLAIFDGVRDGSTSDEQRLERGFVVCDALYAWCQRTASALIED